MRTDVPASIINAWRSEDKTGPRRPTVRATVQRLQVRSFTYDTVNMPGGEAGRAFDRHGTGAYTSAIFGNNNPVREIRNIRSCSWERSLDQDAATCTLVLMNAEVAPLGNKAAVADDADFDQVGHYTFNRGGKPNRWGHKETGWKNVFVPDAIVKTYEGYGSDMSVDPDDDPNLVQTGFWLIDTATLTANGEIRLEMRDLARLLLDQIAFPPVIPYSDYPLSWEGLRIAQVPARDVKGGRWRELVGRARASSSNDRYVGKGLRNGTQPYVDRRGGVMGHYAYMGLRNDRGNPPGQNAPWVYQPRKVYWFSTAQERQGDLVWWQADLYDKTTALNGLRIQSWGTTYIYISLYGKKGWIGRKRIPYRGPGAHGVDIGADIPFVMKVRAEASHPFEVTLPREYGDIRKIRLTMSANHYNPQNVPLRWHTGLRDLMIYTAKSTKQLKFKPGTIMKTVGNYRDYSDIPMWAAAWAGFFHPERTTGQNFYRTGTSARKVYVDYPIASQHMHTRLARGMDFGRFQWSGTRAAADLTADQFDKKPLMDMVNYVRDILGFTFMVDEYGHVTWRMPNIWSAGNYRTLKSGEGTKASPYRHFMGRTSSMVTIDENETLLDYSTTLSSKNIRERIFVANTTGNVGAVVAGYNPVPSGLRRVAGWTDQHFATRRETVVMADMMAARAMFDYRRGHAKTPGNPQIQIDDQIRIYERVTNETGLHYVLGIKSEMNMDEGVWTYDLDTHWLGENPNSGWAIDSKVLAPVTRNYLRLLK